jgi:hypothetical protein
MRRHRPPAVLLATIAFLPGCSVLDSKEPARGDRAGTRLEAHGVSLTLPAGWDGRISVRDWPLVGQALVYFSSYRLPERDDRGATRALRALKSNDVLVGVFEAPREEAGVRPSAQPRIDIDERGVLSVGGVFGPGDETFVASGRAFILNSTFGRKHPRKDLVRTVNTILASLRVVPRRKPLRRAADPAPASVFRPARLLATPKGIVDRCRLAQARSRFPVLCPVRVPRPFIGWRQGKLPALGADVLPAPGTSWRSRSDPAYRNRRFSGVSIGYGAPWEPDSGTDWRAHLWRNHPCCFLHFEVFWRAEGRQHVPPGARPATLGGRHGLLKDATSWGPASPSEDGLYWANHTRFLWRERGVPYVASVHRFGTLQATRALLDRLIRELRPVGARSNAAGTSTSRRSFTTSAWSRASIAAAASGDALAGLRTGARSLRAGGRGGAELWVMDADGERQTRLPFGRLGRNVLTADWGR